MKAYPEFQTRNVHCLDGLWDFVFLGESVETDRFDPEDIRFNDLMPVPAAFDAFPAYAGKRGTAAYKTNVKTEPGSRGRIHFHGLGMWARIYVDGKLCGEISLPYSGVKIDVPPSTRGERELVVLVDNRFDFKRVPVQSPLYDFYAYGGIFRSVEWHEVPETSFERVQINTLDLGKGIVRARAIFSGDISDVIDLTVSVDGGSDIELSNLPVCNGCAEFSINIPEPTPWTPDSPALHTLKVKMDGDDITERFGLRIVKAAEAKILINGAPQKLLGFCRHEAHPQFGPALPFQQLVQDLQILKDLGCNFVRGSHYSQDQRFLDLCDEMGFMVFEETLGWQNSPEDFTNSKFCEDQEDQARLMVRNSYNHPSVIMWGFLNEGHSNQQESCAVYERLAKAIKEEAPASLVTFATCRLYEDLNLDLADVICVNTYPAWYAKDIEKLRPLDEIEEELDTIVDFLDKKGLGDKPVIISEIGAGAIYGWRDPLNGHWSEEYQRDYLELVCKKIVRSKRINGVSLWQFCDCRTYSGAHALRRPRAFNNKGIVDEYRRPKMAYAAVKKIFRKSCDDSAKSPEK